MRTLNLNTPAYQATPVPNTFIDEFLPRANPTYSIVYIYFYRHCLTGSCTITAADAAQTFGILETDIVKCLEYWEKAGLMRLTPVGEDYNIEFVTPEAAKQEPGAERTAKQGAERAVQPGAEHTPQPSTERAVQPRMLVVETRPVYTVEELELYKTESAEVSRLFSMAEQAFGKLLHYNDLSVLFGIYDWLRLPLEVIERLLGYCAENDRLYMRYIEKVAVDWAERGIMSAEEAEEQLRMAGTDYREVMKALGRSGRNPTPKEIKYMDKWLHEYALPLEVVLEACDRTIMNTNPGKFAYCDKIIAEWHKKGVASIADVNRETAEYRAAERAGQVTERAGQAAERAGQAAEPVRKPTRFANFKQREWDFEKIERAERAYLEASLETERGIIG